MSGRDTYDISPVQKKILLERHARATKLRNEYLSKALSPFRHAVGGGGTVDDPAVERLTALRTTMIERLTPNMRSAFFAFGVLGSMILASNLMWYSRERKLKPIRTGMVSYHERADKFA